MLSKGFSIGEMIKFGWRIAKSHVLFFVGVLLTMIVIQELPQIISRVARLPSEGFINVLVYVISFILSLWMSLGFVNISLRFAKGEKAKFRDLFTNGKLVWRFFLASILYTVMLLVGLILLVFPMFMWGTKYALYPYFIIEKDAGAIDSLELSSQATKGAKWDLFGLFVVLFIINFLGALVFLIGLFITIPLSYVAIAYAYRTLVSHTDLERTTYP